MQNPGIQGSAYTSWYIWTEAPRAGGAGNGNRSVSEGGAGAGSGWLHQYKLTGRACKEDNDGR